MDVGIAQAKPGPEQAEGPWLWGALLRNATNSTLTDVLIEATTFAEARPIGREVACVHELDPGEFGIGGVAIFLAEEDERVTPTAVRVRASVGGRVPEKSPDRVGLDQLAVPDTPLAELPAPTVDFAERAGAAAASLLYYDNQGTLLAGEELAPVSEFGATAEGAYWLPDPGPAQVAVFPSQRLVPPTAYARLFVSRIERVCISGSQNFVTGKTQDLDGLIAEFDAR